MQKLIFLHFILILSLLSTANCNAAFERDADYYIHTLDSLLTRQSDLERDKLIRIADINDKKRNASSVFDRFMTNGILAEEYSLRRRAAMRNGQQGPLSARLTSLQAQGCLTRLQK